MGEGRGRLVWAQTANILAMLVNCHSGKKSKRYTPQDFYPYKRDDDGERGGQVTAREGRVPLSRIGELRGFFRT